MNKDRELGERIYSERSDRREREREREVKENRDRSERR